MRYWAQLDENSQVINTSVSDSDQFGAGWLSANIGGTWIEYWKDGGERKNPAGIGYTFDPDKGTDGAFIPPKPYDSWVLNEDTCLWEAPVPMPVETDADGNRVPYVWDEDAGDWVVVSE